MPITGKFQADFEAFYDAVQKAEVSLKGFESGAGKVETSLNKMVDSFSGRKLIQDATLMVEAVDRIGGVSKLTESELAKVAATAGEAAAKLRAMGADVPAGIQKIVDAMKAGHEASFTWLGALRELGNSFVVRVAEGVLLRDAIHEIVGKVKELIGVLPEIALKGAAVADVEENFKHLTEQAGLLGEQLMGTLRAGTHNTITDFELMKTVNRDLGAGLNLTEAQFATMTQGAFALAQSTGGSVAEALNTMNDALLKGQPRALAELTGKVNLEAAERKYAAAAGKTIENLTAAGKLEADRIGILDAVAAATGRLDEQTDGLDERVAQAGVAWENFRENLGKAIATSKTLETGMVGIQQALIDTFGGSQESLIKAIGSAIDAGAIALVGFAETGVKTAGFLIKEWYAVEKVFGNIAQVLAGDALAFEYLALAVAKAGAAMTFGDASKKYADDVKRIDDNITSLLVSMTKRGQALQEDDRQQAGVDAKTKSYVDTLEGLRQKMEAAAKGTAAFVGPLQQTAEAHDKAGKAAGGQADGLFKLSAAEEAAAKKFADAWGELDTVGADLAATISTINPQLLQTINYYLRGGAAVHTLAAAYPELSTAQVEAADKIEKATRKATLESTKLWDELYALQVAHGGTAMDAQIAAIDRWFADEVAKIDYSAKNWGEHWDAIAAVKNEKLNGIRVDWALLGANSKKHLQDIADKAAANYSAALASSLTFTSGFIDGLQKTAIAAQTAADLFGTSFKSALDDVDGEIDDTTESVRALTVQLAAASKELAAWSAATAHNANVGQMNGPSNVSGAGSRVGSLAFGTPSFAEGSGGFQDFGSGTLAMLHGKEAVIRPSDVGSGGTTHITINVTQPLGTPTAIAKAVDDALMARRRNTGVRNS